MSIVDMEADPPREDDAVAFAVDELGERMSGSAVPGSTRRRRRRIGLVLALLVMGVVFACAVAPGLIAPRDPNHQNLSAALLPPGSSSADGAVHLLGTDELGRDELSRIVHGAQPILQVVIVSLALSGTFGLLYGLLAAFAPGFVGSLMMRVADIQLAIPSFVLAVLLAYLVSPGITSSTLAIAVVTWPVYARLVKAESGKLRRADYVLAARVSGLTWPQVLRHHILKNVASVFVVFLSFYVAVAVIIESSLSFLGYGIQPPRSDWGSMLATGVTYFDQWWLAVVPGLAVTLVILAGNTLGEALRERLDPRRTINVPGAGSWLAGSAGTRSAAEFAASTVGRLMPGGHEQPDAARLDGVTIVTDAGRPILRDVSLRVAPDAVTAIVGESGSGKSTVCLAMLGLLPANLRVDAGEISVAGTPIVASNEETVRRLRGRTMGVVFQDPLASLDPVRRVAPQLGEARVVHGLSTRKEASAWALGQAEDLGFTDPAGVLKMHPHQLSGGMRQRICIGIAVSAEPQVLIADEPTTALDVSVRGRVLRSLLAYRERTSCAVVLVTHEIALVEALADRVVVLYGGRVLEHGPKDEVLRRPRSPYTRALMDASVGFDPVYRTTPLPTIAAGLGDDGAPAASAPGCPFAARCQRAIPECSVSFPEARATGSEGHVWCWNPLEDDRA